MKEKDKTEAAQETAENATEFVENQAENMVEIEENDAPAPSENNEIEALKKQANEYKNKYLYLASEFENFKRISARDRREYLQSAGRDIVSALLPILDDFDRAMKNDGLTEGSILIHQKLVNILANEGLKKMETKPGDEFDTQFHDAIVEIPAPELKGKIVDSTDPGYLFKEKILRHAKVVVGF